MIDCRMHHTGSPRWHCRMKAAPFAMILSLSGCGPPSVGNDSLVVFDRGLLRFQVFSIDGQNHNVISLAHRWPAGRVPPVGAVGLHTLLLDKSAFVGGERAILEKGVTDATKEYSWYDRVTGDEVALDSFVVEWRYNSGTWNSPIPFSSRPAAAVAGSGALITDGRTFEIRDYDVGGQLRRIIRVHKSRRPVTKELIEAYLDMLAETRNANRDGMTRQLSEMPIQDTLPAFQSLQIDETGWLWAQVYQWDTSAPKEWIVFDPKGRASGTILTPAGLEVQSIGRDFIVGVWRDQFDVEYVQRHALRRPVSAVEQPTEG